MSLTNTHGVQLLYYALPTAGVLAIDLRTRMQQGCSASSPHPPRSNVSKSEIIKHTSVLAASLQWASQERSSGGNHSLCAAAAKTLERILDDILESSDGGGGRSELSMSASGGGVSDTTVSGNMSGITNMSGTVSGNIAPPMVTDDMDYSMLLADLQGVDSETFLNWFDNLEWDTMMHQPW